MRDEERGKRNQSIFGNIAIEIKILCAFASLREIIISYLKFPITNNYFYPIDRGTARHIVVYNNDDESEVFFLAIHLINFDKFKKRHKRKIMTQAIEKTTYTHEEYFELEFASEERYEYSDGEIRSLAGSTPNHNFVVGNLLVALKSLLKSQPYDVFVLAQRLWLPERALGNSSMRETLKTALPRNIYTYPDIMVLEKPIQLQEGRTDTVMNPCLIAEVLSKSTKDYDRSEKFLAYRTMESFQEYLLIDQYQIHVEHYVKTAANQWLLSEYKDPEVTLNLSSVDTRLKIADLYEDIELTKA